MILGEIDHCSDVSLGVNKVVRLRASEQRSAACYRS